MAKRREWGQEHFATLNHLIGQWKNTRLPQRERDDAILKVLELLDPLIDKVARWAHYVCGMPMDDARQTAIMGFFDGCNRYNPEQSNASIKYLTTWIRVTLQQAVVHGTALHISDTVAKKMIFQASKVASNTPHPCGSSGEAEYLKEKMGLALDAETIRMLRLTVSLGTMSLEGTPPGTKDGSHTWHDMLPSQVENPEEILARVEEEQLQHRLLHEAISVLDERKREIVMREIEDPDNFTLAGMAPELHITRERVRQLQKDARKKIHEHMQNRLS